MKKKLIIILAIIFFCSGKIFSQVKDSVTILPEITVRSGVAVNETLSKAFKKSFPGAQNLHWYKHDVHYLAQFMKDEMDHNALFRKNGYLVYDISFGYEKHLPADVLKMVQSAYDNFKIIRTFNVKTGGRDIWIVNLEGMTNYVVVRVEEEEMLEVERYKKATE